MRLTQTARTIAVIVRTARGAGRACLLATFPTIEWRSLQHMDISSKLTWIRWLVLIGLSPPLSPLVRSSHLAPRRSSGW